MAFQRCDEGVGLGIGHVEAADEAGQRRATPIELETVGFERVHHARRQLQEELVGLDRGDQPDSRHILDPGGDACGGGVGGGGKP